MVTAMTGVPGDDAGDPALASVRDLVDVERA